MNSLAIVRFANGDLKQFARQTNIAFQDYCKRHGFTFIYEENVDAHGRNISWAKIPLLQKIISDFKLVLYVDSDTILLNSNFNALEEIEKFNSDKNLYISRDINGLNCGIFALRNSDFSKELLNKVWEKEEHSFHYWSEQMAFMELENNFLSGNIEYLDQKIWNAYFYELYKENHPEGQVNKNSFILHLPALENKKRFKILNSISQISKKFS